MATRQHRTTKYDVQTNYWSSVEEKAELKALADRLDTSMSEVIRRGIAYMNADTCSCVTSPKCRKHNADVAEVNA